MEFSVCFGRGREQMTRKRSRNSKKELEHGHNGMIVLLKKVHLNRLDVLENLEELFQGFHDVYV
jgi:hypothetical protein